MLADVALFAVHFCAANGALIPVVRGELAGGGLRLHHFVVVIAQSAGLVFVVQLIAALGALVPVVRGELAVSFLFFYEFIVVLAFLHFRFAAQQARAIVEEVVIVLFQDFLRNGFFAALANYLNVTFLGAGGFNHEYISTLAFVVAGKIFFLSATAQAHAIVEEVIVVLFQNFFGNEFVAVFAISSDVAFSNTGCIQAVGVDALVFVIAGVHIVGILSAANRAHALFISMGQSLAVGFAAVLADCLFGAGGGAAGVVDFVAAGIANAVVIGIGILAIQQEATIVIAAFGAFDGVLAFAVADVVQIIMFAFFAATYAHAVFVGPIVAQSVCINFAAVITYSTLSAGCRILGVVIHLVLASIAQTIVVTVALAGDEFNIANGAQQGMLAFAVAYVIGFMSALFLAGGADAVLIGPVVQVIHFVTAGLAEAVTVAILAGQIHIVQYIVAAYNTFGSMLAFSVGDVVPLLHRMFALFAAVQADAVLVGPVVEELMLAAVTLAVAVSVGTVHHHAAVVVAAVGAFQIVLAFAVADGVMAIGMHALSAAAASADAVLVGPVMIVLVLVFADVAETVIVAVKDVAVELNIADPAAGGALLGMLGEIAFGGCDVLDHLIGMVASFAAAAGAGAVGLPVVTELFTVGNNDLDLGIAFRPVGRGFRLGAGGGLRAVQSIESRGGHMAGVAACMHLDDLELRIVLPEVRTNLAGLLNAGRYINGGQFTAGLAAVQALAAAGIQAAVLPLVIILGGGNDHFAVFALHSSGAIAVIFIGYMLALVVTDSANAILV